MNNAEREPRTNQELCTITNRLFYEWQMLVNSADLLQSCPDQFVQNALIESCAIHSRALVYFFYPIKDKKHKTRETDAIADDFFGNTEKWKNSCPKIPKELDYDTFGRYADKQIAHMTYIDLEKHQWDFTLIANALQPILEKFVELVQREQLGDRWLNQVQRQTGSRWETLNKLVAAKNI